MTQATGTKLLSWYPSAELHPGQGLHSCLTALNIPGLGSQLAPELPGLSALPWHCLRSARGLARAECCRPREGDSMEITLGMLSLLLELEAGELCLSWSSSVREPAPAWSLCRMRSLSPRAFIKCSRTKPTSRHFPPHPARAARVGRIRKSPSSGSV